MHRVKASTFADPEDVRRYLRCKKRGGTDRECYRVGDNGIGKWGHPTASYSSPYIALPYEVWQEAGAKGGELVRVAYNGRVIIAQLGDTMPHLDNITNGCGIDLNPSAGLMLGIQPGETVDGVGWEWVDIGTNGGDGLMRTQGG